MSLPIHRALLLSVYRVAALPGHRPATQADRARVRARRSDLLGAEALHAADCGTPIPRELVLHAFDRLDNPRAFSREPEGFLEKGGAA